MLKGLKEGWARYGKTNCILLKKVRRNGNKDKNDPATGKGN